MKILSNSVYPSLFISDDAQSCNSTEHVNRKLYAVKTAINVTH